MITVKNVKIVESMSEETLCFTATVYEDGKKIGTAKNHGHGGNTDVYLDSPRDHSEMEALENAVDEAVYAIDEERQATKLRKKMERDQAKAICVGWLNKNGASYWMQGFKSNPPLVEVAQKPNGLVALQRMYDRIKGELKEDESILNTNLESLGVKV